MVSNQVLQATLENTVRATGAAAAVYESSGKLIASGGDMGSVDAGVIRDMVKSGLSENQVDDVLMSRCRDEADTIYVAAVSRNTPNAVMTLTLLHNQIEALAAAYKEKMDKDGFIKNLILDNLLQIDIYNRAKRLHIDLTARRAVFIIEAAGCETIVSEMLRNLPGQNPGDFYTTVDEENVVIVHELKEGEDAAGELRTFAERLRKDLVAIGADVRVSYGAVVGEIKEVSKSFKEAKLALDVGRIFYEDKNIVAFNNLGIGRLIYQLPLNLCRMFIKEIFGEKTPDQFDKETIVTINKFFENNLNVSETSRQLFIHRNTLVYRLDKIQKNTGLDLRAFDDAITFKIALMVVKYMEYMKKIDY